MAKPDWLPEQCPRPLTRLTRLWRMKGDDGREYLVGDLASCRIIVLANTRKRHFDTSDFHVFVAPGRSGKSKSESRKESDHGKK